MSVFSTKDWWITICCLLRGFVYPLLSLSIIYVAKTDLYTLTLTLEVFVRRCLTGCCFSNWLSSFVIFYQWIKHGLFCSNDIRLFTVLHQGTKMNPNERSPKKLKSYWHFWLKSMPIKVAFMTSWCCRNNFYFHGKKSLSTCPKSQIFLLTVCDYCSHKDLGLNWMCSHSIYIKCNTVVAVRVFVYLTVECLLPWTVWNFENEIQNIIFWHCSLLFLAVSTGWTE